MTTVIITRPKSSLEQTTAVYQQAGIEVFTAPCFDIQTNPSVQAKWLSTAADVWVILSVHALEHALNIYPEWHPTEDTPVIAVGPAVVKVWQQHFKHPIQSPAEMNSEGVIELIKQVQPSSVKILTAAGGRDLLKYYCMQQRISYSQINTYERVPLAIDSQALTSLLQQQEWVILTATSVGILQHFISQFDDTLTTKIKTNPLVVGSARIEQVAHEMGFADIHVAANPSDVAMCEAVQSVRN